MSRLQWTLAGLLLAQLVMIWIVSPWSGADAAVEPHPLLPDLGELQPQKIAISSAEGDSVSLTKRGDQWTIDDAEGYPAAADKVRQLLDSLAEVQVRRPVVSSSRYHDALKVAEDDNERHLRIWSDDDDDPAVDLFLGSSPNYRISHVRLGDDDRVYEVRGLGKYDLRADAKSWIENRLVDIASSDVASVRLKNGHGAFTLTHNDKGWAASSDRSAPAGDLDSSKVETFIRSVSGLRVSEPAGPLDEQAQGLEHPAAELVVTSASSGESVAVKVGAEVEGGEGKRYVEKTGFGFSSMIDKYDAQELTGKKLGEFYPDS